MREELSRPSGEPYQVATPFEFLGPVTFFELPERKVDDSLNETTPSVLNKERLQFINDSATSVTDFLDGQEGQELIIYGDGQTTLVHDTDLLITNTAANKLLAAGAVYYFIRINNVWRELAASVILSAGAGISVSGSTISNKYVGKSLTLIAGSVTHTQLNNFTFEDFRLLEIQAQADLTNLTQYRFSLFTPTLDGTPEIRLQYNIGAGWVAVTAITLQPTTTGWFATSFGTWPSDARHASCRVAILVSDAIGNEITITSMSAEFKP